MKKIAIVNNKGGVGKTTSTANLGACLSQKGYRVLLIDIDPQGNLSKLFKSCNTDNLSVADVLLDENLDIHSVIRKTDFENLDILPANINLTSTEKLILIDENRSQQDRLDKVLLKVN
ncbi:MAG: AAA family ATPase, partial [Clostridium sp.]|nr:AAA family ATPase [Clostridium sp.]